MSIEDVDSLKNASVIIERFGGIRPMAAKVGAPVTTVQGWKKRDVIPGVRRADVIRAANENSIDITDLLTDSPTSTTATGPAVEKGAQTGSAFINNDNDNVKISVEPIYRAQPKTIPASLQPRIDATHEELMSAIQQGQKKAVRASFWTVLAFVLVLGGAATLFLMPSAQKIERHEDQLATLSGKVTAMDGDVQQMSKDAEFVREMVPDDIRNKFEILKSEADAISQDVQTIAKTATDAAKAAGGVDTGSLADRISILEAKLSDVEGGQAVKDLAARIRGLEVTVAGQEQINSSVGELTKIVDSLDGQMGALSTKLAETQTAPQKTALSNTLEGVSGSDMKAAALLIAFSQLRESLNRNAPLEEDVLLLQKLVGNEDPELQAALSKLAPQASKGGILTADGLSNEFKGMAGDIVFSSLKGEDVSVTDKAKVRLTQILNVKKDGELVGGTPTQKTVFKAQEQLDAGDVQGAIATLQTLEGEPAAQAQPFIQQAEATLLADQIQSMLRQMIVANVGTNISAASGMDALEGAVDTVKSFASPDVVKDEESGFAVLPAPKGFKGFSSGQPE